MSPKEQALFGGSHGPQSLLSWLEKRYNSTAFIKRTFKTRQQSVRRTALSLSHAHNKCFGGVGSTGSNVSVSCILRRIESCVGTSRACIVVLVAEDSSFSELQFKLQLTCVVGG